MPVFWKASLMVKRWVRLSYQGEIYPWRILPESSVTQSSRIIHQRRIRGLLTNVFEEVWDCRHEEGWDKEWRQLYVFWLRIRSESHINEEIMTVFGKISLTRFRLNKNHAIYERKDWFGAINQLGEGEEVAFIESLVTSSTLQDRHPYGVLWLEGWLVDKVSIRLYSTPSVDKKPSFEEVAFIKSTLRRSTYQEVNHVCVTKGSWWTNV